jgi:hypothetical protein
MLNEVVSMIYHYHYQWDKRDEIPRNRDALEAMRDHLRSAHSTMLDSRHNREPRHHSH